MNTQTKAFNGWEKVTVELYGNCEVCKLNEGTVQTFIGPICIPCDDKIAKLAKTKWNNALPRF